MSPITRLLAQTHGLNTCWTGLSYSKVPGTYELWSGEKIGCYIALGYGETQGAGHKVKAIRICDKACFTVIDEPVEEPGEWWYQVRSVICFGRVRLMDGEDKMVRLRQIGEKYSPRDMISMGICSRTAPVRKSSSSSLSICQAKE